MNKTVKTWWKLVEKLGSYDTLKFANFHKTFLDQSIWICKWASWWCHRLTTCHIFYFEKFNILRIFVIVCSSYQAVLELTLFYIYSERNWGKSNILIAEIWNFVISVHKMNGKLLGDDIINSLICIIRPTGQEMFLENLRNIKVS